MSRRKSTNHKVNLLNQTAKNEEAKLTYSNNIRCIKPRTPNQKLLIDSIKNNIYTLALGSSGAGKTLISLFTAWSMVNSDQYPVDGIIYVRGLVKESWEQSLGALSGGIDEKLSPLTMPVLDNLNTFMNPVKAEALLKDKVIDVTTVTSLRGRSFSRKIIIADEMQCCPPEGILTILTRVSEGSKLLLLGDPNQHNVKTKDGLSDAALRLHDMEGVGIIKFTNADIQRNHLISEIIDRYSTL